MGLPDMHVPHFLERPTGVFLFDMMPVLSMVVCMPTLYLFVQRGRYTDTVIYTAAFILAIVFHCCQLSPLGLQTVTFLGVKGSTWRTWDIVAANLALARTLGHAVAIRHPSIAAIPNVGLPLSLVLCLCWLPRVDIVVVSAATGCFMLLTIISKFAVDGGKDFPKYERTSGTIIAASFILGLFSFAMPHAMPRLYWFWHSLWHMFMACGFFYLYRQLEGLTTNKGHWLNIPAKHKLLKVA